MDVIMASSAEQSITANDPREIVVLTEQEAHYLIFLWDDLHKQFENQPCAALAFQVFVTLCEKGRVFILQEFLKSTNTPGMFAVDNTNFERPCVILGSFQIILTMKYNIPLSTRFNELIVQVPDDFVPALGPTLVPAISPTSTALDPTGPALGLAGPTIGPSIVSITVPALTRVNTRKVGNVITSKLVDGKTLKIPRPANAFILYRKDKHAKVVKQYPKLHNTKISVIIGSMWQNESTEVRYDYKTRAERVKVEHALRFPGYQYQPRKPSEKKRRMTKKKLNGVDIVPTRSHEIISSFAGIPQAGETVVGDPSETRVVPLPHSTAVTDTIDAHNAVNSNYGIDIGFENPALGFGIGNLTYSDEYEAAQKADLSILPGCYDPLEEFLNLNF